MISSRLTAAAAGRNSLRHTSLRCFSAGLDPANKGDYAAYVAQWKTHFTTLDDPFELERGLNHIFAADWVPAVEVIEESLRAARRLNCFASGVRVLEGLENKVADAKVYAEYQSALKPLVEELGLVEAKEFSKFNTVRDPWRWWY